MTLLCVYCSFIVEINGILSVNLGTKYNSLMKRYQEGSSRLQALEAECVTLSNKCLNECQPRYENLKEKYTLECAERKCLYNELIELKGNIRVFCRCRPLNPEEASKGYSSVLELDPSQDMELQIVCTDSSRKKFRFDHVFGPLDNQGNVIVYYIFSVIFSPCTSDLTCAHKIKFPLTELLELLVCII